jgi:hypothetical protein
MSATNINQVGSYVNIADYPVQGSIANSTVRPYTLDGLDVDSALVLDAIETKLRLEATLDEVFVDLGSDVVFTGKKVSIPDACILRLKTPQKGARTQTIPFLKPLKGSGRYGTDEKLPGYERNQGIKVLKAYYNEYCQGMSGEEWGVNFNDVNKFGLYDQIQPSLSRWFKEEHGKHYREALLQTYSTPLTKTGTALTQNWNPNWFIANLDPASQPAYNYTGYADLVTMNDTFTINIGTAMAADDTGGTAGVNANVSLDYLLALDHFAQNNKRIEPIEIGGKKSYVVLLPSSQYYKLLSTNNGQLGSVWQNVSALSQEEQNFPGIIGRVKSLVIVEDQRYPTIEFDQYTTGMGVTLEYVEPGNCDDRNKVVYNASTNMAWDIGFLMGKAAIVDWEVTPLHFEFERQNYGQLYGKGAFIERGIQLACFDTDTASGGYKENFGSIVLAFTAASLATVA